jgi:hypothetical protein
MNVRALPTVALVGLMSLCLSTWGTAQERRLEVTGFLGGLSVTQDLGSSSNVYLEAVGEGQNVSFGKYLGLRVAFMISSIIGIEGSYSQGTNSYTYSVDDNEIGDVDLGEQFDVKQSNFSGNVLIQYPFDNGFIPYGTVGFGRHSQNPEKAIEGIEDVVNGNDINFGGGVRYFFEGQNLPWLGVRFDFRWHRVSNGVVFEGNEVSPQFTEMSLGVALRPF